MRKIFIVDSFNDVAYGHNKGSVVEIDRLNGGLFYYAICGLNEETVFGVNPRSKDELIKRIGREEKDRASELYRGKEFQVYVSEKMPVLWLIEEE